MGLDVFDLQLFAEAGNVVNASEGYVNAYTGEAQGFSGENNLSQELKTFYDTELLENARVDQFIGGVTKKKAAPTPAPAAPAPAPVIEETAEEEDEGELIAVIAAAVAAAMEAAGAEEPTGFVVRSIRRVNNAPAWNRAGREEQVYSRM